MQKALKFLTNKDVIPVWSNIPFIIPAAIAVSKGLVLYATLIAIAAAVSYYYHHTDETKLKRIDRVLAYSVIAANLYVLYLADFRQPYFAIALLFVAIAFYFFFTGKDHKYDTYHGMWHLSSVVITLMCVLAY
jgi:tellurite resistance protein TehA-like permease